MDINTLIKTAKEYADKVKSEVSGDQAQLAVIADAKGKTFVGVTSVTLKNGSVTKISADYMAALYMINEGSRIASSMVVIDVADQSVAKPSSECLDLLFRTNVENDNCLAAVSDTETATVLSLRLGGSGADLMDGFDFDDAEPADNQEAAEKPNAAEQAVSVQKSQSADVPEHSSNVISGVKIEENNPFYEAPEDLKPPEEVVATVSGENLEAAALEKESEDEPELSKEELLKQAKKRKKVAKANFLFRKRH